MNDILKEIFNSFAEASRIGQAIQIAADEAMKEERLQDEPDICDAMGLDPLPEFPTTGEEKKENE